MDKREFKNPYDDYNESLKVYDFEANRLIDEIEGPLKENVCVLLETLEKHLAAESDSSDKSVYTGLSGIALLYMRFMDVKICSGQKDFLSCALSYIEPFLNHLRKRDVTFLCGVAGPLAIGSVLFHRKDMKRESTDLARRLENLERDACSHDTPDELLYGRVGYLYSLLFLNKYLPGPDEFRDNVIKEVIKTIFESGQRSAKKFSNTGKTPLYYEWHGSPYLGAAHGLAGILYMLLQAKDYLTTEQLNDLVKPSIDYVLGLQYPSGNFPSSIGSRNDKLVHWCHGAPGVSHLMLLAYEIFHDEKYLESAKKCSEVIWQRGLLKKGYGICHGVSGNGYTHLRLFQVTKDVKYLWRALKFAEWCFAYGKHGCRTPDRPLSLFEGFAGTIYYLLDLLEPLNAAFPGFQLF